MEGFVSEFVAYRSWRQNRDLGALETRLSYRSDCKSQLFIDIGNLFISVSIFAVIALGRVCMILEG